MPRNPETHWTCHECGQPIDDNEGVVIIGNFIYHPRHQPSMKVLSGQRPTSGVRAPEKIKMVLGDDW